MLSDAQNRAHGGRRLHAVLVADEVSVECLAGPRLGSACGTVLIRVVWILDSGRNAAFWLSV